ncbi:hypothetical protein PR048_010663 [Dryococelus australis]|uniref:Uncharacterized protein n=1 Tax=Dryococelus australis TaxID=614101 RepID=A0ABQ9I3B9_9NEOP|nr:hypothetical protein PR048_010663 [Dryococelus australis]
MAVGTRKRFTLPQFLPIEAQTRRSTSSALDAREQFANYFVHEGRVEWQDKMNFIRIFWSLYVPKCIPSVNFADEQLGVQAFGISFLPVTATAACELDGS